MERQGGKSAGSNWPSYKCREKIVLAAEPIENIAVLQKFSIYGPSLVLS
jgi:hypothetical protein